LGLSGRELGIGNVGEREGDGEEQEDTWQVDFEQELQTLTAVQVPEGLGADNPFHISQLHIILDRTDALLLSLDYEMGAYDPESSECILPSFTLSL
jgi:nuclear pore complex protein Nup107